MSLSVGISHLVFAVPWLILLNRGISPAGHYLWWPIHPVLFVVWGTCLVISLTASFLVGWLIKTAVTRFGGGQAYRRYKPLFVGLMAGEFVAGIFWAIVGLVYYLGTGVSGEAVRVHPF